MNQQLKRIVLFLTLLVPTWIMAQTDQEIELFEAASQGDSAKVAELIAAKINVNVKTYENITPLMFAAQNGHKAVVKLLIDADANVNAAPDNGITALISAARAENGEIAELLILNNADINAKDIYGASALMYSAAFGYWKMCDMLLFYDAKFSKTNDSVSEIMIASANGHTHIVELLLSKGAKLNESDSYGFTALQLAAQYGHLETVKFLIKKGAERDAANNQQMSALTLAVYNNHQEVAEYLLNNGANPKISDTKNLNLRNIARLKKNRKMLKLLKNNEVRTNSHPVFNAMTFSYVQEFNFNDYMLGSEIGINEAKTQIDFNAGFCVRPFQKAVLMPIEDNTYYQLRENRTYWYAGMNRKFYVPLYKKFTQGFHFGAKALFTHGQYEATKQDVANEWKFAPLAGLFYETDILKIRLDYEYLHFGVYKNPPHRINLTIGFLYELIPSYVFNRRFNWM